jgi:hypothetical protein
MSFTTMTSRFGVRLLQHLKEGGVRWASRASSGPIRRVRERRALAGQDHADDVAVFHIEGQRTLAEFQCRNSIARSLLNSWTASILLNQEARGQRHAQEFRENQVQNRYHSGSHRTRTDDPGSAALRMEGVHDGEERDGAHRYEADHIHQEHPQEPDGDTRASTCLILSRCVDHFGFDFCPSIEHRSEQGQDGDDALRRHERVFAPRSDLEEEEWAQVASTIAPPM